MNIVALAANAAQLIIILAVFFIRGLDLGPLVILLLFLLMPIPFINFLALFFARQTAEDLELDEPGESSMVKREAMRVNYNPKRCPVLTTQGTDFSVQDLSERGVRISASSATPFKRRVNGEIRLLSGDRIRFKAKVIRREDGEAVFQFSAPVGTAVLMEEKKVLAAEAAA